MLSPHGRQMSTVFTIHSRHNLLLKMAHGEDYTPIPLDVIDISKITSGKLGTVTKFNIILENLGLTSYKAICEKTNWWYKQWYGVGPKFIEFIEQVREFYKHNTEFCDNLFDPSANRQAA